METTQAVSELSVIRKIMEDSRRVNIDNGIHYIFWGILITAALLINYAMLLTKTADQYTGVMWLVLMALGGITDAVIGKKQQVKRKVETFAGKILASLWFASGIAMFTFGFIGTMTKAYNPIFVCPIISTALGISYFTSGAIQQIKWLQNIALGWWAGGILLFIFPSIHTLLVFALMLILFQLIPGIILNKKSKQELNEPKFNA